MTNFKIIDLPKYDLLSELTQMINSSIIDFYGETNQICLNTITGHENDYLFGIGSLTTDWFNKIEYEINGVKKTVVMPKKNSRSEEDFTILCNQFKGTKFEEVYNNLKDIYKLGRVRLMRSNSKTCLSWHTDLFPRLHYPIKTQEGCFMIIEDEVKFLEPNKWWLTDTLKYHTAINASKEDRIHLVATILGER